MNDDVMPTSKHSDTVYRDDNNVQQIVSKVKKSNVKQTESTTLRNVGGVTRLSCPLW